MSDCLISRKAMLLSLHAFRHLLLMLAMLALGIIGIKGQFVSIAADKATCVVLPTSLQTEGAEEDNGKAEV